jgi:molybdate transport system substrate-binding protein
VLFCLVAAAACAPQLGDTPSAAAPALASPAPSQQATITVVAAASLTEAFTELGRQFEASHPGVRVEFGFAPSQQLAQQLAAGAPADVFASASQKYMDAAVASGRVGKSSSQMFVRNRLVVIYPSANPGRLSQLGDLARPNLKLVFAAKEVPVGQYSLEFLDAVSKDPGFGPAFKDNVLKNVVSYEDNVKAVLAKVALGEADAGIVYTSDVTPATAAQVTRLDIPDALNVIASYPVAVIRDSPHPDLARAFVDLLLSPLGQRILAGYGFIPAGPP